MSNPVSYKTPYPSNLTRKIILRTVFYLATCMFTTNSMGQSRAAVIATIRNEFQTINDDKSLQSFTVDAEDFPEEYSDGGQELTGFFKAGEIKKIYQWVGFSYGLRVTEFYFKGGELIFVYEKFEAFAYDEKKGERDFSRKTTTWEGRYYFNHQKLAHAIVSGKDNFHASVTDVEKNLVTMATKNRWLLEKYKKKPQP